MTRRLSKSTAFFQATDAHTPARGRAALLALVGLLLALPLLAGRPTAPAAAHPAPAPRPAGWRPGEVLARLCGPETLAVRRADGAILRADSAVAPTLAAWGLQAADEVLPGSGLYRLRGAPGLDVAGAAAALAQVGVVLWAEPNYRLQVDRVPNDTNYAAHQWALRQIQAPAAWEVTTGSPDIIVAALDTGVALDHPDLVGKLVPGYDFVNDDDDPSDDHGHGTYTAGIMAAQSNNNLGVAGVCWGCRVMPVKILDAEGGGAISDFARGIRWAVDHGARVLNISAGVEYSTRTMSDAIRYAIARDVVVVGSAGNTPDGRERWPAAYEEVIAVSATDSGDRAADFASYGAFLDVVAPGVNILSTSWHQGRLTYAWGDGTSGAAPFVSGAAGLLLSQNPGLTPLQVKGVLQDSAHDLGAPGWDVYYGWGRIDLAQALTRIGFPPPSPTATPTAPPTATAPPTPPPPTATATATATPTLGPLGGATLALRPAQAPPGAAVTYEGGGFAPGELVGLRLIDTAATNRYLGAALAGDDGAFQALVSLPPDAVPGPATALAQGTASGAQGVAALVVGEPPPPTTAPSPSPQIGLPPVTLVPATPVPVDRTLAFSPVPAVPDSAGRRYFPAAGHTLSRPFLDYWEAHGGLPIFGYPISEPFVETTEDGRALVVQYFERNRFEYHPEYAGTPHAVLLSLLGREATVGRRFLPAQPFTSDLTRRYFPETGHGLRGPFLRYWERNGGLALFGYPISEEIMEARVSDGKVYTVQYFERNRFEYHPEYAGTPYEVELGLLGVEAARARGLLP
jgi:subtilisin family serine protease